MVLIRDLRRFITTMASSGAISAGPNTEKELASLAHRAVSFGLDGLAAGLLQLSERLKSRGDLAYEASVPLADAFFDVVDRTESLASTLQLWIAESSLSVQ